MAPPLSMSRLWHHVSIPAEVDGFVIPSPTWLPRFVHVIFHSLSLSLPLFLCSLSSLPLFPRSLSRRLLSPLLSGTLARGRNRFSLSHDLSLFFSSFSHSLLLFLAFFLARASLSISLATEISAPCTSTETSCPGRSPT